MTFKQSGKGNLTRSMPIYKTEQSLFGSRKDQLWVLGSTPELAPVPQTGVGDRLNRPWCMVVRSCWHGPNQEGRRVIPHAKRSRILSSFQLGTHLSCNLEPVLADNLLRMELASTCPSSSLLV